MVVSKWGYVPMEAFKKTNPKEAIRVTVDGENGMEVNLAPETDAQDATKQETVAL